LSARDLYMKYLLILVFFLSCHTVQAQTCTGGLGDPITNITFGSGLNFGPPLTSGITNMQYLADQCPNDGQYTITSGSTKCWGGTWLNVTSDHTGNSHGKFMLINASYQPSDFYVQTVTGLCPGTTYQFAAWILNMVSLSGEILPNITFSIEKTDGTLLDSIHTGNVPIANSATWNQYGFYFTTPPGISTVVLRMTNNAPGGIGNDLALDDITFRPAGPATTVAINGYSSDTATTCAGNTNPFQFTAIVGDCYSSPSYQWQESTDSGVLWSDISGAISKTYADLPPTAGVYSYRLTAAQSGNIGLATCKVASMPLTVVVLKIPDPEVTISTPSTGICAGVPATFTARPADGGNAPAYQWQVNGAGVSTAGGIYTSNSFANGDIINCVMTSDAPCLVSSPVVSNSITMKVTPDVISSVQINASATRICSDSIVTFTAISSNGGDHPTYQWAANGKPLGGDTSVYLSGNLKDQEVIEVIMTGSLYCSFPDTSNAIVMTIYPLPVIDLTPDTIIAPGSRIRLAPVITGQIASIKWSPSTGLDNISSSDPLASPVTTLTYQLNVVTEDGCKASAKETVFVYYDLHLPNAFTPNGDGKNDVFRIPASVPLSSIRFSVFNRLGKLVFSTTNNNIGWDGMVNNRPQPAGTYVWMVEYNDPLTKKPAMKKGLVELIR
jgi:gliding motility-associated-like protein